MESQPDLPVEFDGHCAFAVSLGKNSVPGSASCFLIQDGKKYQFSNPIAKFLWRIIPGRKNKAETNWLAR